jgi:sec-independent protein translocase protein TatB
MFNLDPGKLLVIAVVAIILLGPDRLPQVARQVGGAWRSFNEFRHRMESEVRSTMPDLPPTSEIARLARSPSALLNHLSTMSSDEEAEGPDGVAPVDDELPDGAFSPPVSGNGTAPGHGVEDAARADGAGEPAGPETNGAAPSEPQRGALADGIQAGGLADGARAEGVQAESPVVDVTLPRPGVPASEPPDVVVPGDPSLN